MFGCLLFLGPVGCDTNIGGVGGGDNGNVGDGTVVDGNRDGSVSSPLGKTAGEPNDTFSGPVVAVFDAGGTARLEGRVASAGDLDVYLLGPLSAGDRLFVDTRTSGSSLDVSVAVFDDAERLMYANDDRGGSPARNLDAIVDFVVRRSSDRFYLVVTDSAFATPGTRTGDYEVDISVEMGDSVPPLVEQVLLLDFSGGAVNLDTLEAMTLTAFDAGDISSIYDGDTETLKTVIRETMEQNFERFNITITTSDDPPPPDASIVSTIFFGGFNGGVFGVADGVDLYDLDTCDDAIIFVETFRPRAFFVTPNAEELGVAIGNVAAHEAGHLLGLNHVDNDAAIMDDQSAADAFIEDQEFMTATLSNDIMPIGTQDAVLLLDLIVGPRTMQVAKVASIEYVAP